MNRNTDQHKPNDTTRQATIQEEKAMSYDLLVIGGHVSQPKAMKALQIAHNSLRVSKRKPK